MVALGVFAAAAGARAQEHPAVPLRILPLGDSITAGVVAGGRPGSGGYRAMLQRLLVERGADAVLVGTRSDFSHGLRDPWHDGWPGYVIRATSPGAPGQLYGGIARRAIAETHPDVILLMIGTNDFLRYEATRGRYDVDEMVRSMDLLLAQIYAESPRVRVIVGAIVDSPKVDACYVERFDTGRSRCDGETHPSLAALVAAYAARGYAISYAPEFLRALPRDTRHFPDGIHPADGPDGYDLMARLWFDAISEAVPLRSVSARPGSVRRD